ncbi:MAG: DUF502 domain-containing protein [Planctomycetia bacterium]|nr:MAG: DUF502 domain-containing protein [Planctomycetia bacterium]
MSAQPLPPIRSSRLWATFKALFRARITQGVIVILPIWLTIIVVKFVFEVMRDSSQWALDALTPREQMVERIRSGVVQHLPDAWRRWTGATDLRIAELIETWGMAVFSVFLTIFILYLIGLFAANIVGRRAITGMEGLLERVPLVKTVYRSTKQILATFASEQKQSMQRVALVPLFADRVYTIGFITNAFKDTTSGEELCTVFVSSVPSPTTSYVLVVRKADLIELDWKFEDALKMVISGGILLPAPFSIVAPGASVPLMASAAGRTPTLQTPLRQE